MNASPKNRRILLIDDNSAIHADFKKILLDSGEGDGLEVAVADFFGTTETANAVENFTLESAFQGKEGLECVRRALAANQPYALAFVDVRMPPGWDGVETLTEIWKVDPDIQAVICTAYSDYTLQDIVAKLGRSDRFVVLKKPFDSVEVVQLANALTEKWDLLQRVKRQIHELEKDVAARTLELQRTEQRFRLIAEHAYDLITLLDGKGRPLYHSPSYQRTLGYSAAEMDATDVFSLVHSDEREAVQAAFCECFRGKALDTVELRVQHKDGSWRTLEACATLIRNAGTEFDQLLVVSRDITERKKRDAERASMEIHLRHSQKLESLGQLAAGIAHEINTPTQYIGDNTRFLKDAFEDLRRVIDCHRTLLEAARQGAVLPEIVVQSEEADSAADIDYLLGEIPNAIQQSLEGVERVAKIVRAMKDFSHPGSAEKTVLDLNRSIESTITVCRNEWKYVSDLVTEFDAGLPQVKCLPGEINQTILNLIVNAAHAIADVVGDGSNGKGTITVSTHRDGDWAEIRIRDTGTGIPEKAREKIFEPFFTTKGVGKGTGQGLAIARSVVVDKHAGTIRFETEPGKGTVFIIRLPIAGSSNAATARPAR